MRNGGSQVPEPNISDLMRQLRTMWGVNTKEAGERLGLSGRAVEDIEQGRRRADDEITRIALVSLIEIEKKKKKGR
jgi:predicted transcriptional regulator